MERHTSGKDKEKQKKGKNQEKIAIPWEQYEWRINVITQNEETRGCWELVLTDLPHDTWSLHSVFILSARTGAWAR
jgi:hypothetical protein